MGTDIGSHAWFDGNADPAQTDVLDRATGTVLSRPSVDTAWADGAPIHTPRTLTIASNDYDSFVVDVPAGDIPFVLIGADPDRQVLRVMPEGAITHRIGKRSSLVAGGGSRIYGPTEYERRTTAEVWIASTVGGPVNVWVERNT